MKIKFELEENNYFQLDYNTVCDYYEVIIYGQYGLRERIPANQFFSILFDKELDEGFTNKVCSLIEHEKCRSGSYFKDRPRYTTTLKRHRTELKEKLKKQESLGYPLEPLMPSDFPEFWIQSIKNKPAIKTEDFNDSKLYTLEDLIELDKKGELITTEEIVAQANAGEIIPTGKTSKKDCVPKLD